jgi:spore coat protein A
MYQTEFKSIMKSPAQTTNSLKGRRTFIKTLGLAGAAALILPDKRLMPEALAQIPGGTLDPALIPRFVSPLFELPPMPRSKLEDGDDDDDGDRQEQQDKEKQTVEELDRSKNSKKIDYYEIAVRQIEQQVLPPGFPCTTVWAFGSKEDKNTFHFPSYNIEARYGHPVRVKWINELRDRHTGRFIPPLFTVDRTLHWANPPGPPDTRTRNPEPYRGPVPLVTHLHGGRTGEESDGYPEAWYLPVASNIPTGFYKVGSFYDSFKQEFYHKYGVVWEPGTATFQYNNQQPATALWFHEHTLGMTRLNIYAGLVGFYFLRGGPGDEVDGRLPGPKKDGPGKRVKEGELPFEVPLIIQDRSFNTDGSLFYPDSRAFFDGYTGPYIPQTDVPPFWNPEFFGNTLVTNGRTWPFFCVEQRRYRFRVLNASNARFLILKLSSGMPFWQIGSDGGFLPAPVRLEQILISPSERADLIIDFTDIPEGTRLVLENIAPDEPFGGGVPGVDFEPADPNTTGQVLQFRVVERSGHDRSTSPEQLTLPAPPALGSVNLVRQVSFSEFDSTIVPGFGPVLQLLGTVDLSSPAAPNPLPHHWDAPITETPALDSTEIWEIYNFTEDAHPAHIHLVHFEVLNREVFDPASPDRGQVRGPEPWETGRKDTVVIYPGEITRVKAHFDLPGRYVWHCHMLEHEDNEMMRPFQVVQ